MGKHQTQSCQSSKMKCVIIICRLTSKCFIATKPPTGVYQCPRQNIVNCTDIKRPELGTVSLPMLIAKCKWHKQSGAQNGSCGSFSRNIRQRLKTMTRHS